MQILITGGAGFIGLKLARALLAAGHDVTALDNLSPQIHGVIPAVSLPNGLTLIRADVADIDAYARVLANADAVFHLAAETGTGQSMYQIGRYVTVNDLGTARLLEAIAEAPTRPRRIVLASSRSVYGEGAYRLADGSGDIIGGQPRTSEKLAHAQWDLDDTDGRALQPVATPETLPFNPGSVYAATKAAQELLLLAASPGVGAATTIFRFQNVYGEGQSLQNPYTGIISIFFNRARQGTGIPLFEDGLPTRDFVHVDDIVRALVDSLSVDLAHGSVMNLGSGIPTTVADLAARLTRIAGFDVPIEITGRYRVGDIRHNWADLNRARALIGYEPRIGLDEGLSRFVAWAGTQPAYQDRSAQADAELKAKGLTNE